MKQIKISIIGFDNLMESLFAYISKPLLNNDTQLSFNATVGNQKEYDEKISKYDFPIFLKNNYQALIKLKPDILFFAPPPSEATSILKDEIKKYFEYAKKNNLIIPDIYAFPPVPFVEEYQHILGNNIFSVNILPNDIRNIDKKLIQEKGINFCTFSPIYPPEKRIRLEKFISSFGKIV